MSRRPLAPSTPSPEDPPPPHSDKQYVRPILHIDGFPVLDPAPVMVLALAGAKPTETEIEVVARRICLFYDILPDGIYWQGQEWPLPGINRGANWLRFREQAVAALIAVNLTRWG